MLRNIGVRVMKGGFLVSVVDEDGENGEFTDTETICTSYAQLMKQLKMELDDFRPVRKPRKVKE